MSTGVVGGQMGAGRCTEADLHAPGGSLQQSLWSQSERAHDKVLSHQLGLTWEGV